MEYSFFLYLRGFIVLVLFFWFIENVSVFFVALFALKKTTTASHEENARKMYTIDKNWLQTTNIRFLQLHWNSYAMANVGFFSRENAHMKYLASARFECNRQNVHAFCVIWIINSARIQSNHIPNKSKFEWIDRPVMRQRKNSERNERSFDLTTSKEYRKEMQFFGGATNAAFVFYWIFDMYFSETWFTI